MPEGSVGVSRHRCAHWSYIASIHVVDLAQWLTACPVGGLEVHFGVRYPFQLMGVAGVRGKVDALEGHHPPRLPLRRLRAGGLAAAGLDPTLAVGLSDDVPLSAVSRKDMHVFVGAVLAQADGIVTYNYDDFPTVQQVAKPRRIMPRVFLRRLADGWPSG